MSTSNFRVSLLWLFWSFCFCLVFSTEAQAKYFTVTNTNDSGPGSLREAMTFANTMAGTRILFRIPGAKNGPRVIRPLSDLPVLTLDSTSIEGNTQTDYIDCNPNGPDILIDDVNAYRGMGVPGIEGAITFQDTSDCEVNGLVINNTARSGITFYGGVRQRVRGCYLGVSADGRSISYHPSSGYGMKYGVYLSSSNSTVGGAFSDGNVICGAGKTNSGGNFSSGAGIYLGGSNNTAKGNYLGLDASGTVALGNNIGIFVAGSNNAIGDGGSPNVFCGNFIGVNVKRDLTGTVEKNKIQGNYFGLDSTGIKALGSQTWGIQIIGSQFNEIGGSISSYVNYFAGHTFAAIGLNPDSDYNRSMETNTTVVGNVLGQNVKREAVTGNACGIFITSSKNTIGGNNDNVYSGYGGELANTIVGSRIAVTIGSFQDSDSKIYFAKNNLISSNNIGVTVGGTTPVNLSANGDNNYAVTPNDINDYDDGANGLQNYPVLSSAIATANNVAIRGSLASTQYRNFNIEFFASRAATDSGYGPGEKYLGSKKVYVDGSGSVSFSASFPPVAGYNVYTATATSYDEGTSEFSRAIQGTSNNAPVLHTFSLSPTSPQTHTTIITSWTGSDPDGEVVSPTYVWKKGSVVLTGKTTSQLDVSTVPLIQVGDKITCSLYLTDSRGGVSLTKSATVTVVDGPAPTPTPTATPTATPTPVPTPTATPTPGPVVNKAPTIDVVPIQSGIREDGGPQTIILKGISAGEGENQSLTVTATSYNYVVFPNPVVTYTSPNSTAVLTYTPNPNQYGGNYITVKVQDNGGTANGGVDTTTMKFYVGISPVNDAPSFTSGGDVTVNEDSGRYSQPWATQISAGPSNELQGIYFVTINNKISLFAEPPVLSPAGVLSFLPAPHATGSATIIARLKDRSGTANGGIDSTSQTFTITINPINDGPTFVPGGNVTVDEDSGAYSQTWATVVVAGPDNESNQTVAFTVSNNNTKLFSVQPSIAPTGVLTFTPASNASGSATVTVQLRDNGGTANGGQDTRPAQSFTISINSANDVPVISGLLDTTTKEDTAKSITFNVSDVETAAGTLGVSASSSDTTLVPNNALSLSGNSGQRSLKITPALNANGQTTITLTVTDGDGGSFSSSFVLTVSPVNDAPITQGASYSGRIGQEIDFTLAASDIDGDNLTFERVSFSGDDTAGGGQLSGQAPRLKFVSFAPGTYSLNFRVRDVAGAVSNTSTVTFVIGSVSGYTAVGDVNSAEPNTTYSGSVLTPLADVRLRLEQAGRVLATTATNSKGRYTFYGLGTGDYQVYADSININGDGTSTKVPFVLSRTLKIKPTKTAPANAQFSVPVVTFYSVWGQVVAKSSDKKIKTVTPLGGANVRLTNKSSSTYPAFASEMSTDQNGFYLFRYLGKASFNVAASAPGVTFARNGVKVNLPSTKKPFVPAARLDLSGTKNTSSTQSSINAF